MIDYTGVAVYWIIQFLILLLFSLSMGAFAMLVRGAKELRRRTRAGKRDQSEVLLKSPLVPAVSSIAIPPDASAESLKFARRLLDLHFGRNEVVIVLDGPSDAELDTWSNELNLAPSARVVDHTISTAAIRGIYESCDPIRVVVVDKERGSRNDAWNAGVNVATSPILAFLDPDSDFEPFVLLKLIQPMLEASATTLAVCGGGPIAAGPGMASQLGALESLRAWLTRSAAYAAGNRVLPVPGACVLARRSAVIACGGFSAGVFELVARLHAVGMAGNKAYLIAFLPDPISVGRGPSNFTELRLLLNRDQRQIANAYWNSDSVAGPFVRQILGGLFCDRCLRPLLETAAYLLCAVGLVAGWVDLPLVALLVLATAGSGVVISMGAVVLRELAQPEAVDPVHPSSLFFAAVIENFGYRQLRNFWLLASFRRYSRAK